VELKSHIWKRSKKHLTTICYKTISNNSPEITCQISSKPQ